MRFPRLSAIALMAATELANPAEAMADPAPTDFPEDEVDSISVPHGVSTPTVEERDDFSVVDEAGQKVRLRALRLSDEFYPDGKAFIHVAGAADLVNLENFEGRSPRRAGQGHWALIGPEHTPFVQDYCNNIPIVERLEPPSYCLAVWTSAPGFNPDTQGMMEINPLEVVYHSAADSSAAGVVLVWVPHDPYQFESPPESREYRVMTNPNPDFGEFFTIGEAEQACDDLGPNWTLPAQTDLGAIQNFCAEIASSSVACTDSFWTRDDAIGFDETIPPWPILMDPQSGEATIAIQPDAAGVICVEAL